MGQLVAETRDSYPMYDFVEVPDGFVPVTRDHEWTVEAHVALMQLMSGEKILVGLSRTKPVGAYALMSQGEMGRLLKRPDIRKLFPNKNLRGPREEEVDFAVTHIFGQILPQ